MLPPCPNPKVPAPTCRFHHKLALQIRFNDIDIFGHINNSVYLSFMDLAKAEYLVNVTPSKVEVGGIALAVVNINCDFFSPGYFKEPLEVVTAVSRISNRSLCMEQRIFNPTTGDVKCIARTIMAGFDPKAQCGIEIPANYISMIEAFEERKLYVESTVTNS